VFITFGALKRLKHSSAFVMAALKPFHPKPIMSHCGERVLADVDSYKEGAISSCEDPKKAI